LTDPDERAARDRALTSTYADPTARHHEVVAEVELDVDYAGSPIVAGSVPNGVAGSVPGRLAAGARVPDTVRVALGDGSGACHLHQLAHRAGHTLLVLGGRGVAERALTDLAARARVVAAGSALVDAVVGVSAGGRVRAPVARLEPDAADDLGIDGLTFAAVRPDGVVGLRADHDHIAALREYHTLLHVEAMGAR
jgi:hypothetical protein